MATTRRHARVAALALVAGAMLTVLAGRPGLASAGELRKYETRYYDLHTDLDIDGVRETVVRITAMAEEYYQRTKGFSGAITKRLPLYMFTDPVEYYAAGGIPGSAGVFMTAGREGKLMVIAREKPGAGTWHVVQHEGFHQFVHSVIRGDIPVWVNEGLAEYFGEGIYTGDGFVVGVVSTGRLARLKEEIESGKQKSIPEMMALSHKEWSSGLASANYNQGWSMIHFLVHGDDGKYAKALNAFLNDISNRRMRYENAWVSNFGRDIPAFEKRYREYWLAQKPGCTDELYKQAVVATMTSYFARACIQKGMKVPYETPEAFFAAATAGELKNDPKDWLPPSLLENNLALARRVGTWEIDLPKDKIPRLACTVAEGRKLVGQFWVKDAIVARVSVTVAGEEDKPEPTATTLPAPETKPQPTTAEADPTPGKPVAATNPTSGPAVDAERPAGDDPVRVAIGLARSYQTMGLAEKARGVLTEALKKNPASPLADQARRLLAELK